MVYVIHKHVCFYLVFYFVFLPCWFSNVDLVCPNYKSLYSVVMHLIFFFDKLHFIHDITSCKLIFCGNTHFCALSSLIVYFINRLKQQLWRGNVYSSWRSQSFKLCSWEPNQFKYLRYYFVHIEINSYGLIQCCRMNCLTDELTAEKLKYIQVSLLKKAVITRFVSSLNLKMLFNPTVRGKGETIFLHTLWLNVLFIDKLVVSKQLQQQLIAVSSQEENGDRGEGGLWKSWKIW